MNAKFILLLTVLLSAAVIAQPKHVSLVQEESSVTYKLHHPLHLIESTSKDVNYRLNADVTTKTITSVSAQVDVMTFNSGNSNRDSHAMEVIDALSYPEARFTSASIKQNGDSLTVAGKLTFHGVTKDVSLKALSKWSANKLVVEGGFDVSLTEFNIERPSLLMIPVDDTLSFSIIAVFGWQ